MVRSERRVPATWRAPATAVALALLLLVQACAGIPGRDAGEGPLIPPEPEQPQREGWTKEEKLLAVNAGAAAVIAAYGLQFWDYGGANWKVADEGWFGSDTAYGGADKLGHTYASYLATLGFATLYEGWGYEREEADLYGALSSMGAFTLIEVGDAFSKNGWSTEDLVMDAGGVLLGYLRRRRPEIAEYLDFRVEYFPSETVRAGARRDIVTDYSGYKYLFALKLAGFDRLEITPLQYLEVHFGYYTRGFLEADKPFFDAETRHLYVGLGLNMSRILEKIGLKRASKVLQYYQIPYTYGSLGFSLD